MSRRFWFVTVSLFAHVAAGTAIFASGVWGVDRLDRDRRDHATLAFAAPPPAAGGGAVSATEQAVKPKPRVRTKVIVQQPPKQDVDKKDAAEEDTGIGPGKGDKVGPGDDPEGTCTVEPCGIDKDAKQPEPPPKKEEPKPKAEVVVPPNVLTMMRTRGTTQIHPDAATKTRMLHEGRTQSVAVVKICVSETGAIKQLSMLKPSGYPAYDATLLSTIRGDWQYKAHQTNGQAVTACGTVTFQYRLQSR